MINLNFLNMLKLVETVDLESWDPQFRVKKDYVQTYRVLYEAFEKESFSSLVFMANGKVRLLRKAGAKYMLVDFLSRKDVPNEPEMLAWICADALKCTGKPVKRDQVRINSIDCVVEDEFAALKELESQMRMNSSISLSKALKTCKAKIKA